jgi:hypothetical protein
MVFAAILLTVALAFNVKFALKVAFELKVEFVATINGVLIRVDVALVMNEFVLELARIHTSLFELTTIAGPEVLPVVTVKFVVPLAVLIVVVVKDDIR